MKKAKNDFHILTEAIRQTGSNPVKLSFLRFEDTRDSDKKIPVISLIIEGIDNEYNQFGDPKYPANWEIYLMPNGKWEIV